MRSPKHIQGHAEKQRQSVLQATHFHRLQPLFERLGESSLLVKNAGQGPMRFG